jgi:hypothetical protein
VFGACGIEPDAPPSGPISTACFNVGQHYCVYSDAPDVDSCKPAVLTEEWQQSGLEALNEIRTYANLSAVTASPEETSAQAHCALIAVANTVPELNPPSDSLCYSKRGASACNRSNISIYQYGVVGGYLQLVPDTLWSPEEIMRSWIIDAEEPTLGHRRALLNPFLQRSALGMAHDATVEDGVVHVDQAVSLLIQPEDAELPLKPDAPPFIAWPQGDLPITLFPVDARLSFSVVHDQTASVNNTAVSFETAAVTVTRAGGEALTVANVVSDYGYYGIPNQLAWTVNELEPNTQYEVVISGVVVLATTRSYTYTFSLISD